MTAVIVDDERLARTELKKLLEQFPEVNVLADTGEPDEAIRLVSSLKPALLFLDINMPGKNGFELLTELDYMPRVIFVTAYDEFALRAFEVNALDYLLKPVEPVRLEETIRKLREQKPALAENPLQRAYLSGSDQVFVKDGEKCWFVKLDDVRLFESEGNYIRIYFNNHRPLILKSLNSLEEKLNPKSFFRASRKHIVNLNWIEGIENWFNGGLLVKLKGGEQVEISRRQSSRFKEMMSL